LPIAVEELVHVNRRFYLRPLLPLLHSNGHFYVLALSMNEVRLYRGTRLSLDEVEVEGLPEDMESALMHEDVQSSLQHRSWGPRASGVRRSKQSLGKISGSGVVFHGQGSDQDVQKPDLAEYLKLVDTAVARKLHAETAPLIVASVEYEAAIYRQHNHYPHLLEEAILGTAEHWNLTELHEEAWRLVEPHLRKSQGDELNKFNRLSADRISTNLKSIAEAAEQGRVEALFIPSNGNAAPRNSELDEMLDATASAVLRTGGDVYPLPPDEMPQNAREAAAVYRYALR
jgi:hypothetical protein